MHPQVNDTAFTVAANLLLEAQRARTGKAPCRPQNLRRISNDASIADSGFYSSSTTSSAVSINGEESCRATQKMAILSKLLLLFYLDKAILMGDPPVDLSTAFGTEKPDGHILNTFTTSISMATANSWELGCRVASHVLQNFPKGTSETSCDLETQVEVYLSLILSITSYPIDSTSSLERARKLSRRRDGEFSAHVRSVEKLLSNTVTFPGSPTAFEQPQFTPNHLRSQSAAFEHSRSIPIHLRSRSRASTLSMSSTASRFSIASSSKAEAVPAVLLKDSGVLGSFAVTSPAHHSLRKVLSSSSRRRIPFLWLLDTRSCRSDEADQVDSDGIPTISRTPSTYSCSDSERSASPVSVASPILTSEPSINNQHLPSSVGLRQQPSTSKLNHLLAKAERTSKFRTITECSACGKAGLDYPKCPRCEEMWCSRECRLQGGKRHVCAVACA